MTTLTMDGWSGEVRRMRPGLDYTVAHYGILTADPRLDCVLCFCDDRDGTAWEAGEVGGFEAYLLADEEESTAAEVYRQVRVCVWWHAHARARLCAGCGGQWGAQRKCRAQQPQPGAA